MKLKMPCYSIVATAKADRVLHPLRNSHAKLSKTNTLNDGQLIAADALLPGSALLGYVNADHWAVAIPLSKQIPIIGSLFIDDVRRADLVLAAIEVISHQFSTTHE